jgi:hypothetical protein
MMTNASISPRHFAGTLTAMKYAAGKPMNRHSNVPVIATRRVFWNVLKNVSESA